MANNEKRPVGSEREGMMINDTERKAFDDLMENIRQIMNKYGYQCRDMAEEIVNATLKAALSTKAQNVGEWAMVPRVPTAKMLKVGDTVAQIASKRGVYPYIANLETVYQAMLYAAPAPAPCTPEQAAELGVDIGCLDYDDGYVGMTEQQLAAIINADRQKR